MTCTFQKIDEICTRMETNFGAAFGTIDISIENILLKMLNTDDK